MTKEYIAGRAVKGFFTVCNSESAAQKLTYKIIEVSIDLEHICGITNNFEEA